MAKQWEVGETALKQATALVERDPDAAAQVKSGGVSLEAAYDALLAREREAKTKESSLDGERLDDLLDLLVVGLAEHPLGLRALYFFPHRLRVRRPIIGGPMLAYLEAFDPLLDGGCFAAQSASTGGSRRSRSPTDGVG